MIPELVRATIPGGLGDRWLICPGCRAWYSLAAAAGQDFRCLWCDAFVETSKAENLEEIADA